jgi:L-malate glycosyltransferase
MPLKILHAVEQYLPSVGGAQEVVRRISEGLVDRGHDVTVVTTELAARRSSNINGVKIVGFGISGNAVRGMAGEVGEYRRFLETADFDVIMFYAAQQWATDAALDLVGRLRGVSILAPCGFSGLYEPAYSSYFQTLRSALRRFDGMIVHSGGYRDARFLRQSGIGNVTVIPNGAAEDEFTRPTEGFRRHFNIGADERLVVTVGSHTGLKGHGQVIDIVSRLRSGHVTLAVIGNATPGGCTGACRRRAKLAEWKSRGRVRVIVADVPRPSVVSALAEADVVVLASRIECSPLVLYEALASGTPFVSGRAGNAEEIASTSGGGYTVSTAFNQRGYASPSTGALTETLEKLLLDPLLRRQIGNRGRLAWESNHTWSKICDQYEAVYKSTMTRRLARGPFR